MARSIEGDLPPDSHMPLPQMPMFGFIWRSVLFLVIGSAALLIGYWYDQEIGVACGIIGCFLLLMPMAGWHEYKEALALTKRYNVLVDSHRAATISFLHLRMDHVQDVSQQKIEAIQIELGAVKAEREALERMIRSVGVVRDQKGRMRSASRALQDAATAAQVKQDRAVILIDSSST